MSGTYTQIPSEIRATDAALVGGKAKNLARIDGFGAAIPSWYVVNTAAFARGFEAAGGVNTPENVSAALRRSAIPEEVWSEILARHERVIGGGKIVAVRSSAVGEDAAGNSFAGIHESHLFVRTQEELADAIRAVWASAYQERALAYRKERGLPVENVAVAVVVQEMIDCEAAGVLFTANPTNQRIDQLVVSSLWGVGEGLVGAGLDADTFLVEREGLAIDADIVSKETELRPREDGRRGLESRAVPAGRAARPSLTDSQVRALCRVALAVEAEFRAPQDLEFGVDANGRLFLFQARPITTLESRGPAAGNPILWDNSNIIESYSGVTSPFTFSFIRRAYSTVYHCFCEVMGISPTVIRAQRRMFGSMLGLIQGQVFYNLRNWHRLVKLFPGYDLNRGFMESMMGVRESTSVTDDVASSSWWEKVRALPPLLRLAGRSAWNFYRIRHLADDFDRRFDRLHSGWEAMDFDRMSPAELLDSYREMEDGLLAEWKAPIINDFYVMIFYGLLKKWCVEWAGDDSGTLQNDLLCGEGGIRSTEPADQLMRLVRRAKEDSELTGFLTSTTPEEAARAILERRQWPEFAAQVDQYLEHYGYRCPDELKLEEPSLRDRPEFLFRMIRNYLEMPGETPDPDRQNVREQEIRRGAEEKAFAAVGGNWLKRRAFRQVLANARLGVKNRENMRFARTRIYGTLREMVRAVGRNFAQEGLLGAPDDVFFLALDEVEDFVYGTAVSTNLRGLVDLRRVEFDAYRNEEAPADRFETYGMVYHRNSFRPPASDSVVAEDGVLRGTGCCPGVVRGPVKVIRSLADDTSLAGEILVAERTDPGWVTLYPAASGLLIERGSILSHSAIVAREMGLPAIVGIAGLTANLETGTEVEMDGAAGTIRLEFEEPATSAGEGSTAE